jgi:hypothetical protein
VDEPIANIKPGNKCNGVALVARRSSIPELEGSGRDSNPLPPFREASKYPLRSPPVLFLVMDESLVNLMFYAGEQTTAVFSDALPLSYLNLHSGRDSNPQHSA